MKKERFGLILVNLLLFAIACFFLSGCVTYDRFLRKFGHMGKDSTKVTIRDTVITRKDSVLYQVKTDTTRVHQIIQEGKARVIFDRTHTITQVKAECLPDTVYREKEANCPPVASFGVSPWYQKGFWVVLVLLILSVIVYLFTYIFKLSLIKR